MSEQLLREQIRQLGASLYARGLAPGSSGNISVKLEDGFLLTPTNTCLGRLDVDRISKVNWDGRLISGDPPSKEAFLHLTIYQERPSAQAVVHLHSPYAVAVSCLAEVNPDDVIPPITAYYVMRVGQLPLIPYYRPGDRALAEAVRHAVKSHHAVLLANHGPVIAGPTLEAAVYAAEELEETARLFLLLRGHATRHLTAEQIAELHAAFPIG